MVRKFEKHSQGFRIIHEALMLVSAKEKAVRVAVVIIGCSRSRQKHSQD